MKADTDKLNRRGTGNDISVSQTLVYPSTPITVSPCRSFASFPYRVNRTSSQIFLSGTEGREKIRRGIKLKSNRVSVPTRGRLIRYKEYSDKEMKEK